MFRPLLGTVAAVALMFTALAIGASPAAAQPADPKTVVVTVNGSPITTADVTYASEFLGPRLAQIPQQFRGRVIIDILIDRKLFAALGRKGDVESQDAYKDRLAFLTEEALRDIFIEKVMDAEIGEAEVRARYDAEIAKLPKTEEMRARHVLLKTEDEAKAVAAEARGGADFAELAKAKSTGPSGPGGGDLGYFTADKMVPEFSAAAAALEIGAVSDPVKTQFGWHVIKLEDKRMQAPPAFETVKASVQRLVLADQVKARSLELRKTADIKFTEGFEPPPLPTQAPNTGN
ncbi:Foldase protein PrsA precursor [hydrothermal vent metagenome]|uniref:Foldase protein PrsA n=1 Tax=hydrothermal vent metagenome TaxID=652676 RepID=A0A3B0U3U4_9ZZZZ